MMTGTAIVVLSAGVSISASAVAADPASVHADCSTRANGVEPALQECATAEVGRREKASNSVYRDLFDETSAANRPALRSVERAWIGFRDAERAFRYPVLAGGQEASVVSLICRMELTSRRIDDLRQAIAVAKR